MTESIVHAGEGSWVAQTVAVIVTNGGSARWGWLGRFRGEC